MYQTNGGQCFPCHGKDSKRGKELLARWKRDSKLRELHFEDVFKRQGYRCAQSVVACYDVAGGEPTSVCPWGDREPLRDACELDHKVPVADGGVDHPDNLQVLCACCHNVKSAKERRER
jgi:5-methylcytosine-specific restriction endonuclease McrA